MCPRSRTGLHLICSGSVSSENHWARATARLVLPADTRELGQSTNQNTVFSLLANHRRVLYDLMLVWTRWCTMPGSPATWCTAVARWE